VAAYAPAGVNVTALDEVIRFPVPYAELPSEQSTVQFAAYARPVGWAGGARARIPIFWLYMAA
jgi:hypothetical protein